MPLLYLGVRAALGARHTGQYALNSRFSPFLKFDGLAGRVLSVARALSWVRVGMGETVNALGEFIDTQ